MDREDALFFATIPPHGPASIDTAVSWLKEAQVLCGLGDMFTSKSICFIHYVKEVKVTLNPFLQCTGMTNPAEKKLSDIKQEFLQNLVFTLLVVPKVTQLKH